MSSKILNSFEVTGWQESTTVIVCGGAIGSARTAAQACLLSFGSDPEGESFKFAVRSLDAVGDPRFLTIEGDYTLDGGISKFENCRAVESSSGAGAVLPFSFGGDASTETIRIYGAITHEEYDSIPELKTGIVTVGTGSAIVDSPSSAGVQQDITTSQDISLTRTDTGIIVTPNVWCYLDANAATSQAYTFYLHADSGAGFTNRGTVGAVLNVSVLANHLDRRMYSCKPIHLANADAFSDGLFKVKLVGSVGYNNNSLSTFNIIFKYEETL